MNKIKLRSKQFLSMRCKFAHLHHRMIFSFSINALTFLFKVTRPAVYPRLPLKYTIKRKKKQIITHYLLLVYNSGYSYLADVSFFL